MLEFCRSEVMFHDRRAMRRRPSSVRHTGRKAKSDLRASHLLPLAGEETRRVLTKSEEKAKLKR
jgi:hypothetical protein